MDIDALVDRALARAAGEADRGRRGEAGEPWDGGDAVERVRGAEALLRGALTTGEELLHRAAWIELHPGLRAMDASAEAIDPAARQECCRAAAALLELVEWDAERELAVREVARSTGLVDLDELRRLAAEGPASGAALVEIHAGVLERLQPAIVDNGFRVVHSLRLDSRAGSALSDLRLSIRSEPAFAAPVEIGVAELEPDQVQHVEAIELRLDRELFHRLTERAPAVLCFELFDGDRTVGRTEAALELCPPGTWPGLEVHPELLAAFVLPNEPAVQGLLRSASAFLAEWTGNPSLDGYQSRDPARVLQAAGAVYAALQELEPTYATPPASFAQRGQRVRLPHEVVEHRMGTCLDLTLLYAACLEQIGLHPLLLVVEGHAFAGVWLLEESFAEPVVEEPLRLLNHHELGELAFVDPTTTASRPSVDFDASRQAARRHLSDQDRFLCAIDVHRARRGQVLPLATLGARAPGAGEAGPASIPAVPTAAPVTDELDELQRLRRRAATAPEPKPVEDRLDRWCRKLLDLTMRNRLLSFRPGKRTIPLLCPDAGRLEDALAAGAVFRVLPRPAELDDDAGPRRPDTPRCELVEAMRDLLLEDLEQRRIRADLDGDELDQRLVTLYRDARTAVEEGGLSNLYLAIGFLEYRETASSEEIRRAPILLVPVELLRSTARGGITVALGGDQPHVNVTLLEYLRRDHGLDVAGLDPLPEDESGLDVPWILQRVREAIRGKAGWHVVPELAMGIFSFAKILIWNDLMNRHEELVANRLVRHLVHEFHEPWEDGVPFPPAEDLDDDHRVSAVLCPTSADASQLSAVLAAAGGKSFVLQGPPGTGKSQTITNLIAHCLAEGKRVLFVSEKMAALEVVYGRLESVGLSEACLELHSSKARKKEVLEQLRDALEARAPRRSDEWLERARELESVRADLNAYVRALHAVRPSGESAFAALSRLTALTEAPEVELGWADVAATPEARLKDARRSVAALVENAGRVELRPGHPFLTVGRSDYTIRWDRDARAAVQALAERLAALAGSTGAARRAVGAEERGLSWDGYGALARLLACLRDAPAGTREPLFELAGDELAARAGPWLSAGREATRLAADFHARYRESPAELPLETLGALADAAHASWWLGAWSKRRRIRKALRSIAREPRSVSTRTAEEDLGRAQELAARRAELEAARAPARELFGEAWRAEASDWDALQAIVDWARAFDERARAFEAASGVDGGVRSACRALAPDPRQLEVCAAFVEALASVSAARAEVAALLEREDRSAPPTGPEDAEDAVASERALVGAWLERWKEIPAWCSWRRARRAAQEHGLGAIVDGLERGSFVPARAGDVFERAYADAWYAAVSSAEPALARFLGSQHEERIARFRRIDDEVLRLTREELRCRVLAGSAAGAGAPRSSEQGILQRELTKKTRHKALRRLFGEIPTLLPRLKPCMLMSPMSVAQYLDGAGEPFDMVVFDEASQIPVWDAIGAIARARQLVVVGDPKQLPPTTFFERGDDDGWELDGVVEDQESILDECMASRFPLCTLDWHYRSRHESLIEFSNNRYYRNRLITFPACESADLGVSLRHVPGTYDRGKSRTNRVEADALVAELVARLRDPRRGRRSIGVVTFNQPQQRLVEDLLDEQRRRHPELETAFAEENEEPVFVMNLENVQGHERDVILFSVGYGPDLAGRVRMEFGPLNRDGGERRLNVAITRARREAVVFTSLRAEEIDLGRTQARGVHDLKLYLEFAEKGSAAFARELSGGGDVESPFEAEVLEAVRGEGWEVHPQVGCSAYRIDLAVVDPGAPGRYLLGIECDGANYHSAKTARDRDKLRQAVLEGLGWRLHRIWSSDWWHDPERELERIRDALERARIGRMEPATRTPAEPPEGTGVLASAPPAVAEPGRDPGVAAARPGSPYDVAELGTPRGTQAEFHEPGSTRAIEKALDELVRVEGPISLRVAASRVAALWGFERVHGKTLERIEAVVRSGRTVRVEDEGVAYLWPPAVDPDAYDTFRLPGPDDRSRRRARDVPTRELANAARHALATFGGMTEDDLVRELGRLFGYARIGWRVRERLSAGIDRLAREGGAVREGGMVVPVKGPVT